jgi:hypothetical protein
MTDRRGDGAGVWLPDEAPDKLADFANCRTTSVSIVTSELEWIPLPADVPYGSTPNVVIRPGWTSTSLQLEMTWDEFGVLSSDVRVEIVHGVLRTRAGR